MSGLVKLGECSHCGKCCKPPIVIENPCISLGEDRCKFYVDQLNAYLYGHCLIYGRGNKLITAVKDSKGNKITDAQVKWFKDNCIEYPLAEDLQAGCCPSECSFSLKVVS